MDKAISIMMIIIKSTIILITPNTALVDFR